ncbi:hypothetical protein E4U54_006257 [Claviceps lovelessii]|nr:hypothetical protein E4U54_006257 [Claviceps lovelessii]
MAYQPPPGTSSLPPRPPIIGGNNGRSGFKPAFSSTSNPPGQAYASAASSYNTGAPGYAPGTSNAVGAAQYGQSAYPSYASAPGAGMSSAGRGGVGGAGRGGRGGYGFHQAMSQHSYGAQGYHSQAATSYSSAPQIRNPFPVPAAQVAPLMNNNSSNINDNTHSIAVSNTNDYDPDMAAQIAHWQSAYSREPADASAAVAAAAPALDSYGRPIPFETPKPDIPAPTTVPGGNPEKKKTVVRQGGGKKWTDDTLLEWDPAHLRLFVGNLAGETTDDSLLKAFTPWKSVQRAKVVRDKRTNKSKGYGFVSFSDADDFFNAAKTMNGQYIQSHPVIVKKANTEIKAVNVKDKKGGKNNRYNHHGKKSGHHTDQQQQQQQHQSGAGHGGASASNAYEHSLGPASHAGVTKPGQKTKNGLRLLG